MVQETPQNSELDNRTTNRKQLAHVGATFLCLSCYDKTVTTAAKLTIVSSVYFKGG